MVFAKRVGWIGVDVGTHTVKLAQAERTAAGVRLRQAVVIQRPAPWSDQDAIGRDTPLASHCEIYAGRNYGGFVGRNAAGTLPMNICQLHGLTVPQGTDDERLAMIASELAEDWDEQISPMEFGFWELDVPQHKERAGGFNVNVLAVTKPWIAQIARDCQQAHLDCWAIDGVPLAMARAVSLAPQRPARQISLALDWGYSNVTLCVVADNRPLYSRDLRDCGLRQLLDSICTELGVTEDEAQHLVDAQGFAGSDNDANANQELQRVITEAASSTLRTLTDQVQRTLQYIHSQRRHLSPTAVWLMGGGATMRNIGPNLSQALEMPVNIWRVPTDSPQLACASGDRVALFGPAVALSALAWRAA